MDVGNIVVLQVHDLLGVLDDSRRVGGEEELGGHGHAIVRHEGTGLRAVEQGLVGSTEESIVRGQEVAVLLLQGNILRGGLSRESGILLRVLDVDEVNLHALLGLDTNNEGRTLAGGNDLMGVVDRLDEQTVSTLKLGNDGLGQIDEVNTGVEVVQVLGQLRNALGIRLGLELEALGAQQGLELLVVGDDTIVDNREFPSRVGSAQEIPC